MSPLWRLISISIEPACETILCSLAESDDSAALFLFLALSRRACFFSYGVSFFFLASTMVVFLRGMETLSWKLGANKSLLIGI